MKNLLIISFAALSLILLSANSLFLGPRQEASGSRLELAVRNIGHRILLSAGDSSSRILPVRHLSKGIFQLEFQRSFSFNPDTLVKIVRSSLGKEQLPAGYEVIVSECGSPAVVYGFAIAPAATDIISCLGRVQPKRCYSIQIAFLNAKEKPMSVYYYFIAFAGLVTASFAGIHQWRKKTISQPLVNSPSSAIGKFAFYKDRKILVIGHTTIPLSEKEAEILDILSLKPNELITREQLLKEVWEDHGVFTGRSLDMFISRLRKKIAHDPGVQISNVHGRGYKLEIGK